MKVYPGIRDISVCDTRHIPIVSCKIEITLLPNYENSQSAILAPQCKKTRHLHSGVRISK